MIVKQNFIKRPANYYLRARGYAQDAVVRAELTARRLERIREVDLADDGRILVVDRQVVDHAE